MKKFLALLTAGAMAVSLAACGTRTDSTAAEATAAPAQETAAPAAETVQESACTIFDNDIVTISVSDFVIGADGVNYSITFQNHSDYDFLDFPGNEIPAHSDVTVPSVQAEVSESDPNVINIWGSIDNKDNGYTYYYFEGIITLDETGAVSGFESTCEDMDGYAIGVTENDTVAGSKPTEAHDLGFTLENEFVRLGVSVLYTEDGQLYCDETFTNLTDDWLSFDPENLKGDPESPFVELLPGESITLTFKQELMDPIPFENEDGSDSSMLSYVYFGHAFYDSTGYESGSLGLQMPVSEDNTYLPDYVGGMTAYRGNREAEIPMTLTAASGETVGTDYRQHIQYEETELVNDDWLYVATSDFAYNYVNQNQYSFDGKIGVVNQSGKALIFTDSNNDFSKPQDFASGAQMTLSPRSSSDPLTREFVFFVFDPDSLKQDGKGDPQHDYCYTSGREYHITVTCVNGELQISSTYTEVSSRFAI